LGGKVGIWKEARELVIMREPKSTGSLILPADKVTKRDIPLITILPAALAFVPFGFVLVRVRVGG
jgi:hypothetical protein